MQNDYQNALPMIFFGNTHTHEMHYFMESEMKTKETITTTTNKKRLHFKECYK